MSSNATGHAKFCDLARWPRSSLVVSRRQRGLEGSCPSSIASSAQQYLPSSARILTWNSEAANRN